MAQPRTQVVVELERQCEMVKLTVLHAGFAAGDPLPGSIGRGWPPVLSSLRSLLETGEPLAP